MVLPERLNGKREPNRNHTLTCCHKTEKPRQNKSGGADIVTGFVTETRNIPDDLFDRGRGGQGNRDPVDQDGNSADRAADLAAFLADFLHTVSGGEVGGGHIERDDDILAVQGPASPAASPRIIVLLKTGNSPFG
jgi:hypothetical protein